MIKLIVRGIKYDIWESAKYNKEIQFNNENYNLFLLGNIAPDINNGYIVEGISHIYDHGHTHLYNPENHSTYTNFYQ